MTNCTFKGCTKTFSTIDRFPKIKAFALEIAYDNGMVNRAHPEECFLAECNGIMESDGYYEADHIRLEDWLGTLTQEQLETLAAGEHDDMEALRQQCPTGGPDNVPLCDIGNAFFGE